MSWHQSPSPKKSCPFKVPSTPPRHFKLLVPSSAHRRSRQKYWSSIFPAETHSGKLQETSHTGRKKGIPQRSEKPPDAHQTKHYTHDIHQNSRSLRYFKATPNAGNSEHHQGVPQRCSSALQGERRGHTAALQAPGPRVLAGGGKHLIMYGGPKHRGMCKHDFRFHGSASHVNDSTEDKEAKVPSYRGNN